MKNIVIADEFKPKDFKPSSLLKEYLQLTQKDAAAFLTQGLKTTACPACGADDAEGAFAKFGLNYQHCRQCRSVYINPRPSDEAIIRFYQDSPARKFWNEHLYANTAGKRQVKIIKPRLQWIEDSTQEYLSRAASYVDINANQPGYLKEIGSLSVFQRRTLLNPLVPLAPPVPLTAGQAAGEVAGMEVMTTPWAQAEGKWDVVSLFEVLDHTCDVDGLLAKVRSFLPSGGLCFVTAILASGFDIQTLWEKAQHVYPPDRLNMFTVEGLKALFTRHAFEVLEFSTPGVLDVQIVAKAFENDPGLPLSRFTRYLLSRGEGEQHAFQEFLQANLLSSYGRILIRKKVIT